MNAKGKNARIKRQYMVYLKEAKRQSEASIDKALAAISAFEAFTRGADFGAFKPAHAIGFKDQLRKQSNRRTGAPISDSTIVNTLQALRSFFLWLADREGYRRAIRYSDAEYFNPSNRELNVGRAERKPIGPSIEQLRHVVECMPAGTQIEKRDRAVMAFAVLSGVRDAALITLRLGDVDMRERSVDQDARHVDTKFAKTIRSTFFPVGEPFEAIVGEWVRYLVEEELFGPGDPLFPKTRIVSVPSVGFSVHGLDRTGWSSAGPVRDIFKAAFARAGLPYANPHSLRNTLTRLGMELCRTPEEAKAWSQNLGHERVLTTFTSYGAIDRIRQAAIMNALGTTKPTQAGDLAAEINALLASHGLKRA